MSNVLQNQIEMTELRENQHPNMKGRICISIRVVLQVQLNNWLLWRITLIGIPKWLSKLIQMKTHETRYRSLRTFAESQSDAHCKKIESVISRFFRTWRRSRRQNLHRSDAPVTRRRLHEFCGLTATNQFFEIESRNHVIRFSCFHKLRNNTLLETRNSKCRREVYRTQIKANRETF